MRILSIIVLVAVSVVSFLPCLWAEDTAGLNLTVTFAVDKPPYWVIEPMDNSVKAGETLKISVLAKDPEDAVIGYGCRWWLNGVRQDPMVLPEGAKFVWKFAYHPIPYVVPPEEVPYLEWQVPSNININDVHEFEFSAYDSEPSPYGEDLGNRISKKIRVTLKEGAIISIEINNPAWSLEGMKLGERRSNGAADATGPLHAVKNAGNVPVMVEIGYMPMIVINALRPGFEQGVDTYVTIVGSNVLPPFEKVPLGYEILPGQSVPLLLTFGTPTELSAPIASFGVGYEMRAYALDTNVPN